MLSKIMILSIIHGGYCDPAVNTADIINENCSFFPLKDLTYLRLRQSKQNGRMCNDDKLRSLCCAPVDLHKQGHLALRGKRGLRFIQKIQPMRPVIILCNSQKAFPMCCLEIMIVRFLQTDVNIPVYPESLYASCMPQSGLPSSRNDPE